MMIIIRIIIIVIAVVVVIIHDYPSWFTQLAVFQDGGWWEQENRNHPEAKQALYLCNLAHLCSQLKENKAVFTPHIAGKWYIHGLTMNE